MIRLSQIIESFEDAFLAQYDGSLLLSHLKALAAMKRCRNATASRCRLSAWNVTARSGYRIPVVIAIDPIVSIMRAPPEAGWPKAAPKTGDVA